MELKHAGLGIGLGVFTKQHFPKNSIICEYKGELLSRKEHQKLKKIYDQDPERYGSFVFEFQVGSSWLFLDATFAQGTAGRMVNHSQCNNVVPEKFKKDNNRWGIRFRAVEDIGAGQQILYDYSDKNEENQAANPFLVS